MATCPSCGYEISETASFCTNCGISIDHPPKQPVPKEQPAATDSSSASSQQQPSSQVPPVQAVKTQPIPPAATPQPSRETAVAGVGSFFGLMILFSLPIVGFICCIVFCFVPENKNIKHFAIGYLLYSLLCTLISILIFIGVVMLLKPLIEEIIPKVIAEFKEQFQDLVPGLANIQNLGDLGELSSQDWQKILEGLETAALD